MNVQGGEGVGWVWSGRFCYRRMVTANFVVFILYSAFGFIFPRLTWVFFVVGENNFIFQKRQKSSFCGKISDFSSDHRVSGFQLRHSLQNLL